MNKLKTAGCIYA